MLRKFLTGFSTQLDRHFFPVTTLSATHYQHNKHLSFSILNLCLLLSFYLKANNGTQFRNNLLNLRKIHAEKRLLYTFSFSSKSTKKLLVKYLPIYIPIYLTIFISQLFSFFSSSHITNGV